MYGNRPIREDRAVFFMHEKRGSQSPSFIVMVILASSCSSIFCTMSRRGEKAPFSMFWTVAGDISQSSAIPRTDMPLEIRISLMQRPNSSRVVIVLPISKLVEAAIMSNDDVE